MINGYTFFTCLYRYVLRQRQFLLNYNCFFMSRRKITFVENSDFIFRFIEVCGTTKPAEVARLFKISYQSAKNYLAGRLPNPYVLQIIAETTPYSIHWLLTGEGEKFVNLKADEKTLELTDNIRNFIKEVCLETISFVSVEIKSDKQEKTFILSPDNVKQEKLLEDTELLVKED